MCVMVAIGDDKHIGMHISAENHVLVFGNLGLDRVLLLTVDHEVRASSRSKCLSSLSLVTVRVECGKLCHQ